MAELTKIGDQETALIKKYADQWGTMTDEQALRLITRSLAVDEQIAQLRVKYIGNNILDSGDVPCARCCQGKK